MFNMSFPPPPPGGKPKPKVKKVDRPYWLTMLYEAEAFYRRIRIGKQALPEMVEDSIEATHFGNKVEMKDIANVSVPVLSTGWYLDIGEC